MEQKSEMTKNDSTWDGKTTAGFIPSLPLSLGMLTDQERKLPAMRVQLQLHCSRTQVVSTVMHGRRKSGYWIASLGCYSITEIFGLDNQANYTFSQKTLLSSTIVPTYVSKEK